MGNPLLDRVVAALALLWLLLRRFCWSIRALLRLILMGNKPDRGSREDCCIQPPDGTRPRPDPYIYSQAWLYVRGIAFTWDNPDFTLIDRHGAIADRMNLLPNEPYQIVVRVHDGSLYPAIGTTVAMEVIEFGVSGVPIVTLAPQKVDVPTLGFAEVSFDWTTPSEGGHTCLRATLSHPDDGNPMNNVGQHNTEVARPASPTRHSRFIARNPTQRERVLRFEADSYRLPAEPLHAGRGLERNSAQYLEALRERNNRARFPVSAALQAHLDLPTGERADLSGAARAALTLALAPGQTVELAFGAEAPPAGQPGEVVNIHAFDGATLVGGVTLYVDPEI